MYDPGHWCAFFAERTWKKIAHPKSAPIRYVVVDPEMVYRTGRGGFDMAKRALSEGQLVERIGIYIYEFPIQSLTGSPRQPK